MLNFATFPYDVIRLEGKPANGCYIPLGRVGCYDEGHKRYYNFDNAILYVPLRGERIGNMTLHHGSIFERDELKVFSTKRPCVVPVYLPRRTEYMLFSLNGHYSRTQRYKFYIDSEQIH